MASTISGFTFEELNEGSGRGAIQQDGTAVRMFKIAWTDLPAFIRALNGGWEAINSTTWTYTKGDEHPDYPGVMYCTRAEYENFGKATGISAGKSSWQFAKVTATYEVKRNEFTTPDDIIEEELDFKLEHQTLPGSSHQTSDDSTDVPDDITKLVPVIEYTVTLKNVPNLPGATQTMGGIPVQDDGGNVGYIYSLLGKVNNANFKGAAAGQMLYLGAQARRTTNVFGPSKWNITHKFLYRAVSWKKVFVSAKGDFVEVQSKVGGNKIYSSGSLRGLLPGQSG
jgi:hypothetical protein